MSTVMLALRRHTQGCHQALEQEIGLEQALVSVTGYQRMLRKFLAVYLALEPQLMELQELHLWLPDLWQRRRIPHLLADLRDLNDSAPASPAPIAMRISGVADALGCLYVLEGSTLGGQMIARQVSERLGLTPGNGCRFFSGEGRDSGAFWRAFSSCLEAFAAAQPGCREQMLDSAVATFEAFRSSFAGWELYQKSAATRQGSDGATPWLV